MVNRFDVYLVNLDAEPSKAAKNTRPCVVISPNEINHNIAGVIVAPLTAATTKYPTRISANFLNGDRVIVLDRGRIIAEGPPAAIRANVLVRSVYLGEEPAG